MTSSSKCLFFVFLCLAALLTPCMQILNKFSIDIVEHVIYGFLLQDIGILYFYKPKETYVLMYVFISYTNLFSKI